MLEKEFHSFLKLKWLSEDFEVEEVPRKYLFTKNEFPPLKPTGLDLSETVLATLDENTTAFKNSIRYIIQNIPRKLKGLQCIKFNTRFKGKNLEFSLNSPQYVYVGVLSHLPNPLPDIFENTNSAMLLLDIDPKKKPLKVFIQS